VVAEAHSRVREKVIGVDVAMILTHGREPEIERTEVAAGEVPVGSTSSANREETLPEGARAPGEVQPCCLS